MIGLGKRIPETLPSALNLSVKSYGVCVVLRQCQRRCQLVCQQSNIFPVNCSVFVKSCYYFIWILKKKKCPWKMVKMLKWWFCYQCNKSALWEYDLLLQRVEWCVYCIKKEEKHGGERGIGLCAAEREWASETSVGVTTAFDSLAPRCLNIMASVSLAAASVSHLLLSYIPMGSHSHSQPVQNRQESRANMLMQRGEKEINLEKKKKKKKARGLRLQLSEFNECLRHLMECRVWNECRLSGWLRAQRLA